MQNKAGCHAHAAHAKQFLGYTAHCNQLLGHSWSLKRRLRLDVWFSSGVSWTTCSCKTKPRFRVSFLIGVRCACAHASRFGWSFSSTQGALWEVLCGSSSFPSVTTFIICKWMISEAVALDYQLIIRLQSWLPHHEWPWNFDSIHFYSSNFSCKGSMLTWTTYGSFKKNMWQTE
jgi:hypothetical protein